MSAKSKGKQPPAEEIRRSQILSTFGPGSMVDLPNSSIIVGGLSHCSLGVAIASAFSRIAWKKVCVSCWTSTKSKCSSHLLIIRKKRVVGLALLPSCSQNGWSPRLMTSGTPPVVENIAPVRPLLHRNRLVRGKYLDVNRTKHPVVPVRFVQACVNGHISDINWYSFVHNDPTTKCRGQLWLDEGGTGNDFADIFVRCEACRDERGQALRRPLSEATIPNTKILGKCGGDRPWLGPAAKESQACISPETGHINYNRLLVRSASNAYFSQVLSVISLPKADEALQEAVKSVYEDFLQYAESIDDIQRERRKQRVANALEGLSNEAVWKEVSRRNDNIPPEDKTPKQAEIEILIAQPDEVGEDVPEGNFYARNRSLEKLSDSLKSRIERIVLVHRLREAVAQVGGINLSREKLYV